MNKRPLSLNLWRALIEVHNNPMPWSEPHRCYDFLNHVGLIKHEDGKAVITPKGLDFLEG